MNKVWVVQEGNNDYSPAEQFGEVNFITSSDLRVTPGSRQSIAVLQDLRRFLAQYVPGVDYVVPVGNPMVIALVCLSLPRGSHRFLKWDRRRAGYVPFTLNSNDVGGVGANG